MRASVGLLPGLAVALLASCGGAAQPDAGREQEGPAAARRAAVDACAIVTQADAGGLFGRPASPSRGVPVGNPMMIGECLWEWDGGDLVGSLLLQFRVWGSPEYHAPPEDSFTRAFDLGERGYIRVHQAAGVDLGWIQGGKTIELSYSGAGQWVRRPAATVDALSALARRVAGAL